ncbi:MAG: hypothetical protein ABSA58_25920 [Acetobacteraceae bacterium]
MHGVRHQHQTSRDAGDIHACAFGTGHVVNMVHHGIEYGLMQDCAEGFAIPRNNASKVLREEVVWRIVPDGRSIHSSR